jgi:hemoglobin
MASVYHLPMTQSLYERLGGQAAIMAAVDVFYQKVLGDELTRPFFESLDMRAQTQKQIAFMAWALGGPSEYKGRDLTAAHAKLVQTKGLSDAHFDAVAGHLAASLRELGVAPDLIEESLRIVGSTRDRVLGRAKQG